MKILLHICCAPCSIYTVRRLREQDYDVMGFFFRSNIHPYTECLKRQKTLADYAVQIGLKLIIDESYDLEGFLRNTAYRESERCRFCYYERLRATAITARRGRFDAFSTTLLYSKFQKHDVIRATGEAVAAEVGLAFHYEDFRAGWREGIALSKQAGMYRQQYCGCIYSEKERYLVKTSKRRDLPDGRSDHPSTDHGRIDA
jgi:predicted adenine nucleotide alpha hydrolase (AANH) superfamily ATPase